VVLAEAKIDPNVKAKDLTPEQMKLIEETIKKNYRVEGDLKRDVMMNIKRLKDIVAWRGMRHSRNLPVRGQANENQHQNRARQHPQNRGFGPQTGSDADIVNE
jgi:SSU ribosomal protein S13P